MTAPKPLRVRYSTSRPAPTNAWYKAGTPYRIEDNKDVLPTHLHQTPPGWEPQERRPEPVFRVKVWDSLSGEPLEMEFRSTKPQQFYKVESKLEVTK